VFLYHNRAVAVVSSRAVFHPARARNPKTTTLLDLLLFDRQPLCFLIFFFVFLLYVFFSTFLSAPPVSARARANTRAVFASSLIYGRSRRVTIFSCAEEVRAREHTRTRLFLLVRDRGGVSARAPDPSIEKRERDRYMRV
jgi:hypothetical protein